MDKQFCLMQFYLVLAGNNLPVHDPKPTL